MSLRALIILHPGFEEMEAVTPIDLLARAEVEVVQASTDPTHRVTGRNGITLQATHLLADTAEQTFDAIILPGGPGIMQLRKNAPITECLRRHHQNKRLVACICAAPLLLLDANLIGEINYTAHPSTANELPATRNQPVVIDGNIITSRGAGTATEFALAIVKQLCGIDRTREIAESICWPHAL